MKIAVTYENGSVGQHFGHAEAFKIYEVEDNTVVSEQVVASEAMGHDAKVGEMAARGIEVVICGSLGEEAMVALMGAGITVVSGAKGDADAAVTAYLNDELVSEEANCHEDGDCGCGGGCGGCGGGCGGCGGGCGGARELKPGKNSGKTVKVHYTGTFNDGTVFDTSYDRGQTLEIVAGAGMVIPGFDDAVLEMEVGQVVNVHLTPDQAYGEANPAMVMTFAIKDLPGAENVELGQRVYMSDAMGRPIPVTVTAKDDTNITLDANHEMAGKELNFKIEMMEIAE